jgi:predicted dehydrogenase
MSKIKWGIISTANIGVEKVIPAMQKGEYSAVTAICSRSLAKAQETAQKLGIEKSYGTYEEMLADTEIDAIYNPLPNHLHVPWSIKALQAGKHVLCEKPIGVSVEDGQKLVDAAKEHSHLKVMEAFMYRFHPQWIKAKEIALSGRIGEIQTIQSFFSYYNMDPENVRNIPGIGGGGLLDVGCYSISLSRFIFDSEPERLSAILDMDPNFKVDRLCSGLMDFGDGKTSTFTCGTQLTEYQRVNILGDKGRVEIEIPFNAPPDVPTKIWVEDSDGIEEIVFDVCDQYTIQGDLFSLAILEDKPVPTPIEDSVQNMQVIEQMFASAKEGGWA